jgi:Rieske Fe-S protein
VINRREFLILATAAVAGCTSPPPGSVSSAPGIRLVNAGPVGDYAVDGVYACFRDHGFFIVRQKEKLFALSAICTHKRCRLKAEPDCSFSCPCHGSTFDGSGHVTEGPAKRDLPKLETLTNNNGELIVKIPYDVANGLASAASCV